MTANDRFERELPDLLADLYPVSAPDYRYDLVQRFAAIRQRPAWAFPERWIPMRALELGRVTRPLPWRMIAAVALLVLAVVGLAVFAGSERPLPLPFGPAINGQLVTSDSGDIFLIDPETGVRTVVIGGPGVDSDPVFSRDGTRIAFFRTTDRVATLWLADDRGGGARELGTGLVNGAAKACDVCGRSYELDWSPDGKSILVTTLVDGESAAAIIPTDGSPAHVVKTDMPAERSIWLPSGEVLFRGVLADGFGLFAIRPDGTGFRTVVPAASLNVDHEWDALFFAVSPDGTQVAYQQRDRDGVQKVFVAPAAGGTPRALTTIESVYPMWSPDGTWLAFFPGDGVYVVRADGSEPQRRVVATGSAIGLPARWTPDSTRLVYLIANESTVLVDPVDGSTTQAPWTAPFLPDWQRLAAAR
jgi:hypothetical protein